MIKGNTQTSFFRYLSYIYIPTLIYLISHVFIKNTDIIFIGLFFAVITIASFSSYYLVNKGFGTISSSKLIGKVIPLTFIISIILAILLNILM
ncbi:hypothetical protein ACN68H_08385 [Aerococcus viridans]